MVRKLARGGAGKRGKKTTRRERPPSATASGRMLVLLESIESQNRATSEAVSATRNELRQEMASFRTYVDGRFITLEAAIRHNSGEIRELKSDVQEIKTDVRELKNVVADHTVRLDRIDVRLDGIDVRLDGIETKLEQKADVKRLRPM